MPEPMLTRWGRELDPDRVHPEHPRPQLVRDSHLSLNGWWEYAVTGLGAAAPAAYDGPILVPFSPEATLSGVGRQLQRDELLWYRRALRVPDGFAVPGGRLLLHFGAVDQSATVLLDGVQVGAHHGGHLPFTCDVTAGLAGGGGTLVVRVRDVGDGRGPSTGKQRLERGGIWYTAVSGIWQTVWLEAVPASYVDRLTLVPDPAGARLVVTVHAAGEAMGTAQVRVLADGTEVARAAVETGTATPLPLERPRLWSPADPFRHDVEVRLGQDVVRTRVGIRSFGTGTDADGTPRLLLNGEPFLHVGVLDQGWWPDGLLTPPSDAAMVHDLETVRDLGFTMVRKHLKIEPLRWYEHCDRLGLLVWQDLVNGGERYRTAAVTWPGRWPVRLRDDRPSRRRLLGRGDRAGREQFLHELHDTVELLGSVTSLAVWVAFNEGWGQFDSADVAALLARLDPSRSVDHASGWHDQGAGDLWSHHLYGRRFVPPRRRTGERRVLVLSEYGGHGLPVPGHTWGENLFDYRRAGSARELGEAFVRVHRDELAPLVAGPSGGLSATVWTQLTDVEDEVNGLVTYDREVLKLPGDLVRGALDTLRAG